MNNIKIRDAQISASSCVDYNTTGARFARLGHPEHAWCTGRIYEYLEVDLEEIVPLTYIATQGSPTQDSWVMSYFMKYSVDAVNWIMYQERDVDRVREDGSSLSVCLSVCLPFYLSACLEDLYLIC